jgi:hypothetical protein
MPFFARVSVFIALATLALSATTFVRADATTQKATGTITGRVVDPDGKPIAGAHVRAFDAQAIRDTRQHNKDNPGNAKDSHPQAVAKADTDANGNFTLTNVPAGKIRVMASLQGAGLGMVREIVNVKAAETVNVGDIKLRKPSAGTGGQGGNKNKPGSNAPQQ